MPPIVIGIGPLLLSLSTKDLAWQALLNKRYGKFITPQKPPGLINITIETKKSAKPPSNPKLIVNSTTDAHLISRRDFYSFSDYEFYSTKLKCRLNEYSFDSWLRIFITVLGSKRNILLVHGASTAYKGKAFLFAGVSGSGKSSITKILGLQCALSDELTMLSQRGRKVYAHSTPFWGELACPQTKRAQTLPLGGIFFLRHGANLRQKQLSVGTTLKHLMAVILFFSNGRHAINAMLSSAVKIAKYSHSATLTFSLKNNREQIYKLLKGNVS